MSGPCWAAAVPVSREHPSSFPSHPFFPAWVLLGQVRKEVGQDVLAFLGTQVGRRGRVH